MQTEGAPAAPAVLTRRGDRHAAIMRRGLFKLSFGRGHLIGTGMLSERIPDEHCIHEHVVELKILWPRHALNQRTWPSYFFKLTGSPFMSREKS